MSRKTPIEVTCAGITSSVSAGRELMNPPKKCHRGLHISRIRREETPWGIVMKIGFGGHMGDVITPAIFYRYPIRGSGVTGHGKRGLAI